MTKYQLLFIIENGIDDEAKEAVVTKFTDLIANHGRQMGYSQICLSHQLQDRRLLCENAFRSRSHRAAGSRQADEN